MDSETGFFMDPFKLSFLSFENVKIWGVPRSRGGEGD